MRRGLGMTPAEIGDVFEEWNKTELDSYLIEITAEVLHQVDKKTGKPLVDVIVDHAGMKAPARGPCRPHCLWPYRSPASPKPCSPVVFPPKLIYVRKPPSRASMALTAT